MEEVSDSAEEGPQRIGNYQILEKIGEGGMGTVYAARQEEPVRRKVALKLIKAGMDSAQVVARFAAERQALALMSHVGIAQVYDGGVTEAGRPYFAMEYVPGIPITEYCDRHKRNARDRIKLFLDVCDAVQHAHQKGVIHRDLKPSNVLVSLVDDKPVPKIIDFGVARATSEPLTEETLHTHLHQIIGTLDYMSPEQADPTALDIDTRADIYSLGVLLYQLLTGVLPFDRKELRELAFADIQRTIREKDPPVPSTRVRRTDDESTTTLATHGTEGRALVRQLRGDLDWITMMAMEKDRTRRYPTAAGLAADLQRYLNDEPVVASPPSTTYRLRKFVRRNRGLVTAATLLLGALLAGVVGTTWGMLEASDKAELARRAQEDAQVAERDAAHERDQARLARDAAEEARSAEESQRKVAEQARTAERDLRVRAEREAEHARATTGFLVDILGLADPEVALQSNLSTRGLLERAALRADVALQDQPEAQAAVRTTIGKAFLSIGDLEQAEVQLTRALELLDAEEATQPATLYPVVWSLLRTGVNRGTHVNELVGLGTRWLYLVPQMISDEHERLREAFSRVRPGEPPVDDIKSIARAELAPGDPLWLVLGDFFWLVGWFTAVTGADDDELALNALEESLRIRRAELPETHPEIAAALNLLVALLNRGAEFERAEALVRESIEIRRRVLPEGHVGIASSESLLGECLAGQGREQEAEGLLRASSGAILAAHGPNHPETIAALSRVVRAYVAWKRPAEAEPFRRELANSIGTDPFLAQWPAPKLAFGPEHAQIVVLMNRMLKHVTGNRKEIELTWDALRTTRASVLPAEHPLSLVLARYLVTWVELLENSGARSASTEAMLREALALFAEHPLAEERDLGLSRAMWWLANHCQATGRPEEGERLARECLRLRQDADSDGPGSWTAANARSMVGACLLGQGRYAEAEPLLVESCRRLLEVMSIRNGNTRGAYLRVNQLYAAWGDPLGAESLWSELLRQVVANEMSSPEIDDSVALVVSTPGFDWSTYELAREAARLSAEASPAGHRQATLRLAAHYRAGRYDEVLRFLPQIDAMQGGALALDWAVYAMALEQLGEEEQARSALELARDAARDTDDGFQRAWLEEAQALVR